LLDVELDEVDIAQCNPGQTLVPVEISDGLRQSARGLSLTLPRDDFAGYTPSICRGYGRSSSNCTAS
jgi:hypothetical protein